MLISSSSWDGPGKDLQSLFDGWVGPGHDVNANYESPSHWTLGATGQASSTLIVEIAGNAGSNTIGLYDVFDPNTRLQLYDGATTVDARRGINYDATTHNFTVGDTSTSSLLDTAQFTGGEPESLGLLAMGLLGLYLLRRRVDSGA
jgi:hypothetical protein